MVAVQSPVEGLVAEATRTVLATLADEGVPASFGLPARFGLPPVGGGQGDTARSVWVWPLALQPERTAVPEPDLLRLRVRFLVAGDGSADSLELVDHALRIVANAPHLVLVAEPLPVETWAALRLRPGIAVVLDVPVRVPRPPVPQPRVRGPLKLGEAPMGTLIGRVLGPGEVPVPEILVNAPALSVSTRTGRDGTFVLTGVPGTGPIRLEVSGKGLHLSTEVVAGGPEPLVLRCQFEGV
jgi:hypothetical protein